MTFYRIERYPMAGNDKVELEDDDKLIYTTHDSKKPELIILWILRSITMEEYVGEDNTLSHVEKMIEEA